MKTPDSFGVRLAGAINKAVFYIAFFVLGPLVGLGSWLARVLVVLLEPLHGLLSALNHRNVLRSVRLVAWLKAYRDYYRFKFSQVWFIRSEL